MSWDEFYINLAIMTATKSKDESTQTGSVIVGPAKEVRALGFNGLPRGNDDAKPERHERPLLRVAIFMLHSSHVLIVLELLSSQV